MSQPNKPLIGYEFDKYNPIGKEEIEAATKVMKSGILSGYIARGKGEFNGGPKVKEFERDCEKFFNVKHAITVNSWTSGLICAVGALDLNPGDEIIVTPWTMCATATAIINWNCIPRFVDIDKDTFCLDPKLIEKSINSKTKAIMTVDIGGHPSNTRKINEIAKKYKLKVISDTAQAPFSKDGDFFAGTNTDIGGYSLNYHKHINTGEGGILVTNDDELALRMRLIRNHGEACVEDLNVQNISNIVGYNFRLGEIECAIGIEQLKKLPELVNEKRKFARQLNNGLKDLKGLSLPYIHKNCTHSFYIYKMKIDPKITKVSRDTIFQALVSEVIPGLMNGFANLHLLPLFQKKIAYGDNGFPWNSKYYEDNISYQKGICPVAEYLQEKSFLGIQMCMYKFNEENVNDIIKAFQKVWNYLID